MIAWIVATALAATEPPACATLTAPDARETLPAFPALDGLSADDLSGRVAVVHTWYEY